MLKKSTGQETLTARIFTEKDATGLVLGIFHEHINAITLERNKDGLQILISDKAIEKCGIKIVHVPEF